MAILNDENFTEVLADRETQPRLAVARRKDYIERRVRKAEFSKPDDGWYVLDDTSAKHVKLAKPKPESERFEDRLWVLLSRMGFRYLSRDRNCKLQYADEEGATQQVDILAVDDECALVVECKCAEGGAPKPGNFKTEIESLGGKRPGLHREIRERFGKPNLKIAYLLATKDYIMKQADLDRLKSVQIRHFSDADLEYDAGLVDHLGQAARFQFEADIFNN
jgi:DNA sulfur modification protein DndB